MRLYLSHQTVYRYDPPPSGIIQILRKTPTNHDGQYVADWQIETSTDCRLQVREDAFGNVTHVLTEGPIGELTIRVDGQIETSDTGGVLKGADERFPPSLFLRATPLTAVSPAMRDFTAALEQRNGRDPLNTLHALMVALHARMTFDTGKTDTRTTAADAFDLAHGVCQDYAHIFIGCARSAGVPARFVSGHLYRADHVRQEAGHAWAEAFVEGLGWVAFDPANSVCATEAYVRVAVALDYLGAAPVRGTHFGGGNESMDVAVLVDQAGRQSQS